MDNPDLIDGPARLAAVSSSPVSLSHLRVRIIVESDGSTSFGQFTDRTQKQHDSTRPSERTDSVKACNRSHVSEIMDAVGR